MLILFWRQHQHFVTASTSLATPTAAVVTAQLARERTAVEALPRPVDTASRVVDIRKQAVTRVLAPAATPARTATYVRALVDTAPLTVTLRRRLAARRATATAVPPALANAARGLDVRRRVTELVRLAVTTTRTADVSRALDEHVPLSVTSLRSALFARTTDDQTPAPSSSTAGRTVYRRAAAAAVASLATAVRRVTAYSRIRQEILTLAATPLRRNEARRSVATVLPAPVDTLAPQATYARATAVALQLAATASRALSVARATGQAVAPVTAAPSRVLAYVRQTASAVPQLTLTLEQIKNRRTVRLLITALSRTRLHITSREI